MNPNPIIDAATSQGWAIGLVAAACVSMFATFGIMLRWFVAREAKTAGEALTREGNLRAAIVTLDSFVHETLVGLIKESTAVMRDVVRVSDACLAHQRSNVGSNDVVHSDAKQAHQDALGQRLDMGVAHADAVLRDHREKNPEPSTG